MCIRDRYQIVPYRIQIGKDISEAFDIVDDTYEYILIAGGDGTVDSVVNAMIKKGKQLPIAILPVGTANDFGMFLGMPEDVTEACENILKMEPKSIDMGKINDKYFVNVASTGLFTDVSQKTDVNLKNTIGKLEMCIRDRKYNAMVDEMKSQGYCLHCCDVILKYAANNLWKD